MCTLICLVVLALNVFSIHGSNDVESKFEYLFNEVEALKAKDAYNEARIDELTTEFARREQALLAEIADLRSACKGCSRAEVTDARSVKRAVSQTDVAFYAIAPDYDFSVMGQDTNLIYDTPLTNIGNAFHNSTGTFVAPVRGVYVLFVTVGGNIHNSNYFHIDVEGMRVAYVLMEAAGPNQSSQTVIVCLKPGDTVAVKAGRYNAGAYGAYYTTIGGFLLYENCQITRPANVGK